MTPRAMQTKLNRISQAVARLCETREAVVRETLRKGVLSDRMWGREQRAQAAYDEAMLSMSDAIRRMGEQS